MPIHFVLSKMGVKGTFLNIVKPFYYKIIVNIILSDEKLEIFSLVSFLYCTGRASPQHFTYSPTAFPFILQIPQLIFFWSYISIVVKESTISGHQPRAHSLLVKES